MSWFALDDKCAFHPKAVAAGNAAWGAFTRLGPWASDHLSDGVVPADVARLIASRSELAQLVKVGLLEPLRDGFLIHDYLDYNPSRAEKDAERDRKQGAGRQGAAKRWGRGRAISPAIAGAMAPPIADGTALPSEAACPPARAFPVPVPVPSNQETPIVPTAQAQSGFPLVSDAPSGPDPVREVFEHWVAARASALRTTSSSPPRLNDARRKKIRDRLKDYTVNDLFRAIDGNLADEWHVERRQVELEYVLRDDAHVDKFIALAPVPTAAESRNDRGETRKEEDARWEREAADAGPRVDADQSAVDALRGTAFGRLALAGIGLGEKS